MILWDITQAIWFCRNWPTWYVPISVTRMPLAAGGGEEFLIILFNTPGPEAAHLAEKLCGLVASHHFSVPRALTISLGVGEMRPGESLDVFLCRVDDNLYRAKESGRNQIYFE